MTDTGAERDDYESAAKGGSNTVAEFEQHDRGHNEGRQSLMNSLVLRKGGFMDPREQWIVNDLHKPDQSRHE